MTDHNWSLHRINYSEPNTILQPHLEKFTLGRSLHVNKQLQGVHISRRHAEIRKTIDPSDNRIYWEIVDVGSSTKTFLNNVALTPHQPIRLNDHDLLGFGTNVKRDASARDKRTFLYEIKAPTSWNGQLDSTVEGEDDVNFDAVTPPPSPSQLPDVVFGSIKSDESETSCSLLDNEPGNAPPQSGSIQIKVEPQSTKSNPPNCGQSCSSKICDHKTNRKSKLTKSKNLLSLLDDESDSENEIEISPSVAKKSKSLVPTINGSMLQLKLQKLLIPENCSTAIIGSNFKIRKWLQGIKRAKDEGDSSPRKVKRAKLGPPLKDQDSEDSDSDSILTGENLVQLKKEEDSDSSEPEFIPCFSQEDKVIVIDSDDDTDYFTSSQELNIKQEEQLLTEEGSVSPIDGHSEDEFRVEDEEDNIIEISDEDLDESQKSLFNKVLCSIKQEPVGTEELGKRKKVEIVPSIPDNFETNDQEENNEQAPNKADEIEPNPFKLQPFHDKDDMKIETEAVVSDMMDKVSNITKKTHSLSSVAKQIKLIEPLPLVGDRQPRKDLGCRIEKSASSNKVSPTPIEPKSFYSHKPKLKVGSMSKKYIKESRKRKLQELAFKKSNTSIQDLRIKPNAESGNVVPPGQCSANQEKPLGSIRKRAELRIDHDGQKVIQKLKFSNVITNLGSQDTRPGRQTPKRAPKANETNPTFKKESGLPNDKEKKTKGKTAGVKWKETADGRVQVQVKYIPKEGFGKSVKECQKFHANTSNRLHQRRRPISNNSISNTRSPVSYDIMNRILNWNISWLSEQALIKDKPPPVEGVGMTLCHVPPVFDNFRDYTNTFYPLLLHELWASVFREHETISSKCPEILMVVTGFYRDELFSNLRLLGLLTDSEKFHEKYLPLEGSLVKLDLRFSVEGNREEIRAVFGYVSYSRVRSRNPWTDQVYIKTLTDPSINKYSAGKKHLFEADLVFKLLPQAAVLAVNKPIIIKQIARIKPLLRPIDAVEYFCQSSMFQCLLFPMENQQCFSPGIITDDIREDIKDLPAVRNLNSHQLDIIKSTARQLTVGSQPHVSLIQGPPGTGKTSTLVGLVLQIFSRWRHMNRNAPLPRILICCASNAAVDEILKRLLRIRMTLSPETTYNMIRIGMDASVHPEVRGIRLESLTENEMRKNKEFFTNCSSVEKEIKHRQQNLNDLGAKLRNADDDERLLITRKIKMEQEFYDRAKASIQKLNQSEMGKDGEKLRKEIMDKLLEGANVIGATLNSSLNGQMRGFFLKQNIKRPFTICIMDEASQCLEPLSLIPLRLGFNKLVLVGDPEQLSATVNSHLAKNLSLSVSLYHRLYNQFKHLSAANNPLKILKIQYRMHPEICKWPNRYFYGRALENGNENRDSKLEPMLLFDLKGSREKQCRTSLTNEMEANFVVKIVQKLRQFPSVERNFTIGIITFYANQVKAIQEALVKAGYYDLNGRENISIRSVDGFQGNESDIVIISCVRSHKRNIGFLSEFERLNVALTRARYALYIVGNFDALKANDMWRDLIKEAKDRNLLRLVNQESRIFIHKNTAYRK